MRWPSLSGAQMQVREQEKKARVIEVRFVHDHPDTSEQVDELWVRLDRPVDPLTLSARRFSVVSGDRRVLVVQRARLRGDDPTQSTIVLEGRFGDRADRWAHSLALMPGLFGADGVAFDAQETLDIIAPVASKDS